MSRQQMHIEKTIHTGLYSKRAKQMLVDIIQYVINEWDISIVRYKCEHIEIEVMPDGEVVLQEFRDPNDSQPDGLLFLSNDQALEWLCRLIKKLVVDYALPADEDAYGSEDIKWKKSPIELKNLNGETVASMMVLHAVLSGKRKFEDKDDDALAKELIGRPNDPVTEGMIIARNDEIEALKKEYDAKIDKIRADTKQKRSIIFQQLDDLAEESSKLITSLEVELQKAYEGVMARYEELMKPISDAV